MPPRKSRIAIPLITLKVIALQPRHAISHRTRRVVEHKLAAERLSLPNGEPWNAISRPCHGNPVFLIDLIDAAIDALAQLREQKPVVRLGPKNRLDCPL